MSRCSKLLDKARRALNNLAFDDLCKLAECAEFERRRQSGSHVIFRHPAVASQRLNLQSKAGKAKPYQVKQVLDFIDEHYPNGLPD